tara:strand:+ start:330 stop:488 length:159 start_codon:yes stop_codon:yes gene_type:complete
MVVQQELTQVLEVALVVAAVGELLQQVETVHQDLVVDLVMVELEVQVHLIQF